MKHILRTTAMAIRWQMFFVLLTISLHAHSQGLLVENGKSDYQIFVSETASVVEKHAALELQTYLEKISGCQLPVVHQTTSGKAAVYIGFKNAPKELLADVQPEKFDEEEFIIRSDGKNLLLAGGAPRGTLYGVIGYLSDYLGCRWYTREVTKVPQQKTIRLTSLNDRQKPSFEYREAWYEEAYNSRWAMHNRLNPSGKPIPDSLGGSYITYPFVHTFYALVPPETHFKKHPEYFSEVAGVRKGKDAQLCLTNPEVLKIATAQVFAWMKEHPEANVFSVDQNDGEAYCECVHCKAIDDKEGSHSGSLLAFVNRIADTVGKVYPDIKLQTLAYAYTEIPPATIRPADNVTIRLCHYDYCSAHPIEACDNHKPYRDRIDAWQRIAKRVTVWDYFTDFSQYLMPFPNFETLKNDVRYYADRGIVGLFAQGNNVPDNGGGEFSELRAWVFAQLMWNAKKDGQKLIDEFVANVYGSASPYISAYIGLLHQQVKPKEVFFGIWSHPIEVNYLGVPTIQKADSLFQLAFKAAQGDTALAGRVELAYLPVLYTKLFFYSIGGTAYLSKAELPAALARFRKVIAKHRIRAIGDMEATYGNLAAFISRAENAPTFYSDWWLAGPFDNSDGKGLAKKLAPEKGFNPKQNFVTSDGEAVSWKKYEDRSSGYIDFAKLFSPNENVIGYAARTFKIAKPKTMKFGVGSNDGVRVWVNGKLVLDRPVSRKAEPNQDIVEVPMQAGENTVLVKVDQLKRAWGFYFSEL